MPVLQPTDIAELSEIMAGCGAEGRSVELRGNFSKRWMGGPVAAADTIISAARMNRVVNYEPRDLTISVEAGMPFRQLQDLLRENNEMLALDPPMDEHATVGGVMAANCSGPRRRLYGSARDLVIGMTFVTLEGKPVRSGGMVVKNVAGLDMAKLMIGSFGTLAAIARVNFKLVPLPPREKTFLLAFASLDSALKARDVILRGVLQPVAIDLLNPAFARQLGGEMPDGYALLIEAGGIDAVMSRYEREIKNVARETQASQFTAWDASQAEPLWGAIRNFSALNGDPALESANGGAAIVRISTVLTRLHEAFAVAGELPALARAGSGVAYIRCAGSPAGLAAQARAAGLYTVIESSSAPEKSRLELWADPGSELELMLRIKRDLDPRSLLNHGRLYNRI